jgi:hypothetical protein
MPRGNPAGYPRGMSGDTTTAERLEMLLVLGWLDEGQPSDGAVALSIPAAADDLDLDPAGEGLLGVLAALTALEESGRVRVTWPRGPAAEARVVLAEGIRDDAGHLFGDPGR